jgi:TolB-like protein/class 3 adenylate cyclase
VERRLAAILAADVVGYSRLMGKDEAATLAALKAHRAELIDPKASQYNGRTIKLMGDGALMEFPSVVEAVAFAVEVQLAMRARNADLPEDRRIHYRIGINIGDIIVEGDDIYGDGVNIAARLEALAEPGGICVRRNVRNQVRDKLDLDYEDRGEIEVKNIARPIRVFSVVLDDKAEALVTPVVVAPVGAAPIETGHRRWLAMAAVLVLGLVAAGGLAWWQPWVPIPEPISAEAMALPLPDKPSIAVLPFANLSGDAEQDYFVDGFTNAIITNLSKFPEFFVIASNSVFTYRGKPVRVSKVGRELGVRYVLEGSFQRVADKVSVHAQLIEAASESHIWAQRYDVAPEEIFDIQNDLSQVIASTLAASVINLETSKVLTKDVTTLAAYELFLRASKYKDGKAEVEENVRLLERAIELDPDFHEAYSELAWRYLNLWQFRLADDPDAALKRARESARKAVSLDQNDYRSHWALGQIALVADQDHDFALAEYEKAIALSPNQADVIAMMSIVMSFSGRAEEGVEWLEKAKRLNPYHPVWYDWNAGFVYFMARDYEKAVLGAKKTLAVYPKQISARRILIAAYVETGRMEDAKKVAQEILEIDPGFTLSSVRATPFQHAVDRDRYYGALRQAGLPE